MYQLQDLRAPSSQPPCPDLLTADLLLVSVSSLGYNDLGFRNNNEIDTPHLDALALGGIVLDRYCTPTHLLLSLEIAAQTGQTDG